MNIAIGFLTGNLFTFGSPSYGHFSFSFFALIIFSVYFLRKEKNSSYSLAIALYTFTLSHLLWFYGWLTNGLTTLSYLSKIESFVFILFVLAILSIPSFILALFFTRILNASSKLSIRIIIFILMWTAWETIYSWKHPVSPMQFFPQSLNEFYMLPLHWGVMTTRLWYYSVSLGLSALFLNLSLKKKITASFAALALFLLGFVLGKTYQNELKAKYQYRQPVILVQDNDEKTQDATPRTPLAAMLSMGGLTSADDYKHLITKIDQISKSYKHNWVVWGESALGAIVEHEMDYLTPLVAQLKNPTDLVLTGMTRYYAHKNISPHNSIVLLQKSNLQISDKVVFFLIGEKSLPIIGDWLQEKFGFQTRPYNKNSRWAPLLHQNQNGPVFIPLSCLEGFYLDVIKQRVSEVRKLYPHREIILLNSSNDTLLLETPLINLHSDLMTWNAAAIGLPIIRANRSGISELIAPWGETLVHSRPNRATALIGQLPLYSKNGFAAEAE